MAKPWNKQIKDVVVNMKGINSKTLCSAIRELIEDGLKHSGVDWEDTVHRDTFVTVLNDVLDEYIEKDLITQYNVMCDKRNNPTSTTKQKITFLEVSYKQKNCLNNTTFNYEIVRR